MNYISKEIDDENYIKMEDREDYIGEPDTDEEEPKPFWPVLAGIISGLGLPLIIGMVVSYINYVAPGFAIMNDYKNHDF